jgi:tRNA pseudouridine55 synthase
MTRELTNLVNEKKSYRTKFTFGKITDTYDKTGEVIEDNEISKIDAKMIGQQIKKFLGTSEQLPPIYSAKKIKGVRAYKLARRGEKISRKPQQIKIYQIKINAIEDLDISLDITCSKGTYIRSLAYDLGIQTGYGAYVKELRRLSINGYSVHDALSIEEFVDYWMSLN